MFYCVYGFKNVLDDELCFFRILMISFHTHLKDILNKFKETTSSIFHSTATVGGIQIWSQDCVSTTLCIFFYKTHSLRIDFLFFNSKDNQKRIF